MHYFIDGYNLIFRLFYSLDDLKVQREQIIKDLQGKIQCIGLDVTLVFDAQYQYGEMTRSHFRDLEVVFTAQGETADEYILNELKDNVHSIKHTVVTSDKKLAWQADRRGAKTESVEEFIVLLNKRYKNKLQQRKKKPPVVGVAKEVRLSEPKRLKSAEPKAGQPSSSCSADECFGYYLEAFEMEYKELATRVRVKPKQVQSKPKVKSKKKDGEDRKEDGVSDWERWLKAFSRDV